MSKKNIPIWSPVQVISIDVYALLDLGPTLSFVTSLVAKHFDVLHDILVEPFLVTILVGDSIVVTKVSRSWPISMPNRVTLVHFIEQDMVDLLSSWERIGCMLDLITLIVEQGLLSSIFPMNSS